MRLVTFYSATGTRRAGALVDANTVVDLAATDPRLPDSLRLLLAEGADGLERAKQAAASPKGVRVSKPRLAAPIPDPGKIICIGLNYVDHAAESGQSIPNDPVVFSKYNTSVIGPGDAIEIPPISEEVDYEVELVAVIGRKTRNVAVEQARGCIAGYCIGHDVSARDWQLRRDGKQWMMGKTFDTFAPMGPWLVTADEVPDPHNLRIALRLNGTTMQDSNTGKMAFKCEQLVAHLSKFFTLEPGDVLFTGTPPGVGTARKPPVYLKPGDVCELEIDGLGVLSNPCVAGKGE